MLLDGWLFANVSGLDLLACGFVVLRLCFSVGGLLAFNSVDYYVMSFRFNELLSLWGASLICSCNCGVIMLVLWCSVVCIIVWMVDECCGCLIVLGGCLLAYGSLFGLFGYL